METTVVERPAISKTTIGERGLNGKVSIPSNAVNELHKNFNLVNNTLSDLAQFEADCEKELKELSEEIKNKTYSLKNKQKELRATLKNLKEKRLLVLGERSGYVKQIRAIGGKIKSVDTSKLLDQIN